MKRLKIEPGTDFRGTPGWLVQFSDGEAPVFVASHHWVGMDFDGTLARNDNPGNAEPPYSLGEPIPGMLATVKALLAAGVTVKIFTARACEAQNVPIIQDWTERNGLGRLEVTNQKDFNLIRFYDDRAIGIPQKSRTTEIP